MSILKAVIYLRVSTDEQAEKGTSLETQEATCTRRAAELQAEVVNVIRDEGISGARYFSRSGIQEALAEIEAGDAQVLIVYSISRLSRDSEHQQNIKKRIERVGGRLVVCDMPMEDTAEGDLMFTMSGAFAQYERGLIRSRTMAGKRRRAETGEQPCRTWSPYGYQIVKKVDVLRGDYPASELGQYIILEEQAVWVRRMYEQYLQGASLRGLCRMLEENGIRSPRSGKTWVPISVKALLDNPVYKGVAGYGRHRTVVDEARLKDGYKHADYQVKAAEKNITEIPVPALVDVDTWNAVQQRLRGNQSSLGGNPERRFLLSGFLRCPHCGGSMGGGKGKGYGYYQCSKSRTYRNVTGEVCLRKSRRADIVDAFILKNIEIVSQSPELFASALKAFGHKQAMQDRNDAICQARRELAALEREEELAVKMQIEASAKGRNVGVYDKVLSELDARRKEIEARIAVWEQERKQTGMTEMTQDADRLAEMFLRVGTVLNAEELKPAEKHALLTPLVSAIHPLGDAHEDGYEIILRSNGETVQRIVTFLS